MVQVEAGLDLLLLPGGAGDGPVNVADGDGEPVHVGFPDEPGGLVWVREPPARGKKLIVGGERAGLVAQHGAELRFDRDARGMGYLGDPPAALDIPIERQAGAVDHDRAVAGVDRPADHVFVINLLIVLVDDRDMIQVKPGEHRVLDPRVFVADGLQAPGFEFHPLEPRDRDEPEAFGIRRARTISSIIGR